MAGIMEREATKSRCSRLVNSFRWSRVKRGKEVVSLLVQLPFNLQLQHKLRSKPSLIFLRPSAFTHNLLATPYIPRLACLGSDSPTKDCRLLQYLLQALGTRHTCVYRLSRSVFRPCPSPSIHPLPSKCECVTTILSMSTTLLPQHQSDTMDFQIRPTDLPAPDLNMDFGWQADVCNEFLPNSQYALGTPTANMPSMSNQLNVKPKYAQPFSVQDIINSNNFT